MAEAIGGPADVRELPGVVPVHDLRPDRADAVDPGDPHCGLHHPRDAVGIDGDVVVREEHVVGLVGHGKVKSGLEGARGPRVLTERDHASLAEGLGEQLDRSRRWRRGRPP